MKRINDPLDIERAQYREHERWIRAHRRQIRVPVDTENDTRLRKQTSPLETLRKRRTDRELHALLEDALQDLRTGTRKPVPSTRTGVSLPF